MRIKILGIVALAFGVTNVFGGCPEELEGSSTPKSTTTSVLGGFLEEKIDGIHERLEKAVKSPSAAPQEAMEQAYREAAAVFFQIQNGPETQNYRLPKMAGLGLDDRALKATAYSRIQAISQSGKMSVEDLWLMRSAGIAVQVTTRPVHEDPELLEQFASFKYLTPTLQAAAAEHLKGTLRDIERLGYGEASSPDVAVPPVQAGIRLLQADVQDFCRYLSPRLRGFSAPLQRSPSSEDPKPSRDASRTDRSDEVRSSARAIPRSTNPSDDADRQSEIEMRQKLAALHDAFQVLVTIERHSASERGDLSPANIETVAERNARMGQIAAFLSEIQAGRPVSSGDLASPNRLLSGRQISSGGDAEGDGGDPLLPPVISTRQAVALMQARVKALARELKRRELDEYDRQRVLASEVTAQFRVIKTAQGAGRLKGPSVFQNLGATLDQKIADAHVGLSKRIAEAQKQSQIRASVREANQKIRENARKEAARVRRLAREREEENRRYAAQYSYEPSRSRYDSHHGGSGSLRNAAGAAATLAALAVTIPVVGVVGLGTVAMVASSWSDEAYLSDAQRDYEAANAPDHIENLVQLIEGRGNFGTPTPYTQAEALRILHSRFGDSYYDRSEHLDETVSARVLEALENGKLKLETDGYTFTRAANLGRLLTTIKKKHPENAEDIDRQVINALARSSIEAPVKAILVSTLDMSRFSESDRQQYTDYYFEGYTALDFGAAHPGRGSYSEDIYNSLELARRNLSTETFEAALVDKMKYDYQFRRDVLADEQKTAEVYASTYTSESRQAIEQVLREAGKWPLGEFGR